MTPDLVTLSDPSSPAAEAYRRLRVNLMAASRVAPLQTLLVVAAGPDAKKAHIVANLAVAFAKVGKRVILADCDLRRPSQHAIFGLNNEAGVTSALMNPRGGLALQDTAVPGLQVLTSGPPVETPPADLIASPQLADLLAALQSMADVTLFDAPPINQATEAVELATHVNGVLLVLRAGQTKRGDALQAKELLTQVHARLVGAVLVDARP